ncbi:STAS-like domain-containing protein [Fodinibius sp. SL11]|uniref:STAS-like domain-containing protein n=1 Tax=Fodinibius sp. SL11 TaxID=3425690 RepID=UPI003F8805E0
MSIFDKHINLRKEFDVSALNNRATAKKLVKRIESSWANTVVLDFSDIEFASRSFLDELNSHLPHVDKEVKKTNMNASVREMDELVQQPKEKVNYSSTDSEAELLSF